MAARPDPPRDPVSVVLPVRDRGPRVEPLVWSWVNALNKLGRGWELIVVDDGSGDGTADRVAPLAAKTSNVRLLRHDAPRGTGACLRTALPEVRHPLLLLTAADYPYTPGDLKALLDRVEVVDEYTGHKPDLVSGCRTGRPVPFAWRVVGAAWRAFSRVVLGLPLRPMPGWLGLRAHAYSYLVWWVFAVPLTDVNSGFKLVRTPLLRRFPIQSDGEFVHAEVVAKATFLGSLLDEVELTPAPPPTPVRSVWQDMVRVFRHPEFTFPPATEPATPPEPPAMSQSPADGVSPSPLVGEGGGGG